MTMTHTAEQNRAIAANVFRFTSPAFLTAQVERIVAASMASDAQDIAKRGGTKIGATPVVFVATPGIPGRRKKPMSVVMAIRAQVIAAIRAGHTTGPSIMAAVPLDRLDWKSQSVAMVKAGLITCSGRRGQLLGQYAVAE